MSNAPQPDLSFQPEDEALRLFRLKRRVYKSAKSQVCRTVGARLVAYPGATGRDRLVGACLYLHKRVWVRIKNTHGIDVITFPQYRMWSEWADKVVSLYADHSEGGDRLGYIHIGARRREPFYYEIGDTRRLNFALFANGRLTVPCAVAVVTRNDRAVIKFTPMWDLIPHNYEFYD